MSDYLSNLAARSFNPTQVIQPRVAGRFEPPRGAAGWGSAPDLAAEPLEADQLLDDLVPDAAASPQATDFLLIGRSLQGSSPSHVAAAPDRQRQPQPEMPLPPTFDNSVIARPGPEHEHSLSSIRDLGPDQKPGPNPRDPASPQASLQPSDGGLPSSSDGDRPPPVPFPSGHASDAISPRNAGTHARWGAGQPAIAPPGVEEGTVSAEPWLPAHRDETEAVGPREATGLQTRPNAALQGHRTEPRPAAAEVPFLPSVPLEPTPVRVIRPASAVTVVVPPHVTTPGASNAPTASAATPTPIPEIRVTIGRIEVHALMPPTPPAQRSKPPRSAPLLSLDDYLKQRQEGRR